MKGWKEGLQRLMVGRYGVDGLSRFLMNISLVLLVAGILIRGPWLDMLALVCLGICYFRMFSRQTGKRYQENQVYEAARYRVMERFRGFSYRLKDHKDSHIYKCPKCGQKIRIPRGKGRISIHCPKCGTDFIKKS